jgi:3-methylcrotonyl-CoA carboxylase alpha subunit
VFVDGRFYDCVYVNPLEVSVGQDSDPGALSAPMPGKVISILVKPGQSVQRNTPLLVMEAMKMEHTVMAPIDGVIDVIRFEVGEQVVEGAELLTFVVQAQP